MDFGMELPKLARAWNNCGGGGVLVVVVLVVGCYTDPAWLSLTNERKFVD